MPVPPKKHRLCVPLPSHMIGRICPVGASPAPGLAAHDDRARKHDRIVLAARNLPVPFIRCYRMQKNSTCTDATGVCTDATYYELSVSIQPSGASHAAPRLAPCSWSTTHGAGECTRKILSTRKSAIYSDLLHGNIRMRKQSTSFTKTITL